MVAAQDAGRIFPRDRGTGLDLRPRNLRAVATTIAALGHEIVDAALALAVAGIPVLHGRIFDLGVVMRDQLDDRRMQLVLVAHGGGAAFKIAHVRALVGDDERALELPRIAFVDAEIGRQFHRAAHARRDVDERSVREHGAVEGGEIIVRHRHHSADVLAHQLGMLLQSL